MWNVQNKDSTPFLYNVRNGNIADKIVLDGIMHIGKEIRELLRRQGRSVVWFSQAIKRSRQACHSMFKSPTIDTDLLKTICEVLGHDFFKDLSAEVELKK